MSRAVCLVPLLFAIAVAAHSETLPIRAYTINEGLAHNHVSCIHRDSHDFLWICTDDGLSRFDGRAFVNYTVANGLPHMHVNDFIESRTGEYWIATDGGVTLFRPNDIKPIVATYRPPGPPESLFVNALLEEPSGAVLLGTAAGLYRLQRTTSGTRIESVPFPAPFELYEAAFVNTIHLDRKNGLWVGAASGLYWRRADGEWTRFSTEQGLPHNFVDRLTADPEGRIWACTRHGLVRITSDPRAGDRIADLTLTDLDGLPHRDVRSIAFASDGRRWIATLGGLVEWRPAESAGKRFRAYTEQNGLMDRAVYAVADDPEGNLWVGTRRGGAMRISRAGFQTFSAADGLVLSGDDGLVETQSGHICVTAFADSRRPIRCYDGQKFQENFPRLPGNFLAVTSTLYQSSLQDRSGNWWISTSRGLLRFAGGTQSLPSLGAPEERLLPSLESRKLHEDSQGDLWIATNDLSRAPVSDRPFGPFGLTRWERATGKLHDYANQLPGAARERTITVLAEAPRGQIWIGLTRPGGLFRYRDGRFQEIPDVPAGSVNALHVDRAGRLWIAFMESGVGRIDHPDADLPAMKLYTRIQGLSSNEVWSLTQDHAGNIYAGTAGGVDKMDPATGRIFHYSVSDGLTPGDIRAAICDRNGDLWFLSNRGLSRFRPGASPLGPPPVTRITGIRVGGALHHVSELGAVNIEGLEFSSSQNSIEVDYSAIDYMSERLQYQYRLDGSAEAWSALTTNETVHFANLAPGRYRFLVRAVSSERGGLTPASIGFRILSPVWQRWWFIALAATLGALTVYTLYRYRVARLLEVERVRTRIATDLHDDLGSNLSMIAMVSEVAQQKVRPEDRQMRDWLSLVADTSREMLDSMNDLVWAINPEKDRLEDMIQRMRRLADDIFSARSIEFRFDAPSGGLDLKLGAATRREVFMIFKESVNNIARHSDCTSARIEFRVEGNSLSMKLEDNGRGFDLTQTNDGNGLASMRRRSVNLDGTLEIASQLGQGTTITLKVPATRK